MSERFTAVIKIVKVEDQPSTTRGMEPGKKDTELLQITVRTTSLEGLIAKSKAHLDLVEDHTK